ncbi:MAG: hypothetical protein FJW32_08285 [Acidobacteria bacterium]|nr:hypothetical protein [Acidobacteriota bacterium]
MTKTVTFMLAGALAGGYYEPAMLQTTFAGLFGVTRSILVAVHLDSLQAGTWYMIGGLVVMGLALRASTR